MSFGIDHPRDPGRAEQALAEFFERVDSGEKLAFESWVESHPAMAAELRELYAVCTFLRQPHEDEDPAAADAPELETLGRAPNRYADYLIAEQPLAEGGMGTIFSARDRTLRRDLALKVLRAGGSRQAQSRRITRFLTEARVTSQLAHPGIVPVYELGLDSAKRPYFTMKRVQGETLERVFERVAAGDPHWTQARALGVLQRVCEAVSFAHAQGVIHRDLKPANVMVGGFGDVYVMDWGLARVLGKDEPSGPADEDAPADTTRDGDVLGTPVYMAPEQAAGKQDEVGRHSDVYAVGALLYRLLAGRAPYSATDGPRPPREVLRELLAGPPEPLSRLAPRANPELVAICERAMERDWRRRYPDMAALAAELSAYLEGRVVRAHATGAWVETKKWVQRNRALAGALVAALVILVAGTLTSLVYAREARARETRANEATSVLERVLRATDPALGGSRKQLLGEADAIVRALEQGAWRDVPAAESSLQLAVARVLLNSGRPERALAFAQAAVATRERLGGPPTWELLEAHACVGDSQLALGRPQEALASFQSALGFARQITKGNDDVVVHTLLGTVNAMGPEEDQDRRLDLATEALEMSKNLHPEGDSLSADALRMIGNCHELKHEFEQALSSYRSALEMFERLEPGDSVGKSAASSEVGHVLTLLHKSDEALPFLERAVASTRRLPSEAELDLQVDLFQLGQCLAELKRYADAVPVDEEALQLLKKSGRPEDFLAAKYARELAFNLDALGQDARALELLKYGVDICEKTKPVEAQGPSAWASECVRSLRDLAHCLVRLGRPGEALPWAEKALGLCSEAFPEDARLRAGIERVLKSAREPAPAEKR